MSITPPPVRRVQVFELLNITRLTSVVVVTDLDEAEVRRRLAAEPPPMIASWDAVKDDLSVQLLSPRLPPLAAEQFVASYLENMRPRTWRYLVWKP